MSSWERRLLLDQETQASDDAVRRFQLPRGGLLSGLLLRIRGTNGTTSGREHLVDAIDRIEVVADGSNFLFSLEGVELYRWACALAKKHPPQIWTEALSAVQMLTLPILFGRFVGDPLLSLDLSQYRDVELRITYSPTISATAFVTGTMEFSLIAFINDTGSPPGPRQGWLRTTQVFAFTSAASGDETIEMARMFPLFDALIYAREDAINDGVDITRVEWRANDRAMIPHTGRWDDLQAENELVLPFDPTVEARALMQDDETIDLLTGRILGVQVSLVQNLAAGADFTLVYPGTIAGDRVTTHMFIVEASSTYAATILETTLRQLYFAARGLGIPNAVLTQFALGGNPELALMAPDLNRLQLVLTNGAAGADVRVSTRELVTG